jgi:hypothetical protein
MDRVNRVTTQIGVEAGETTLITLYKNNIRLAEVTNRDIDVPDFFVSGVDNRNTYQSYCKDVVINLLQNEGIEGYYYEAKAETPDHEVRKYTSGTVNSKISEYISSILVDMTVDTDIKYKINEFNDDPIVTERYKDGSIKFCTTKIKAQINNISIIIEAEIRSGQMCKPKKFTCGTDEYQFNITSLHRLVKLTK